MMLMLLLDGWLEGLIALSARGETQDKTRPRRGGYPHQHTARGHIRTTLSSGRHKKATTPQTNAPNRWNDRAVNLVWDATIVK